MLSKKERLYRDNKTHRSLRKENGENGKIIFYRGDEMTEDPQDMFRDRDKLFSHLYTRMTRDFEAGELKGIRLPQDPAA
jgi:hypothetical protein